MSKELGKDNIQPLVIETERLRMTLIEYDDIEEIRMMKNDPTTNKWHTHREHISPEEQERWFWGLQGDPYRQYLTIRKKTGEFAGIIRSDEWDRENESVRIGLDIAPKLRGQGLGKEAFRAFIDHCFEDEHMHRIHLSVARGNLVAYKLYEDLGFKIEGIQRESLKREVGYEDYFDMGILDKEWQEKKR